LNAQMPGPNYYRSQAQRCLLLSRSTLDRQARLWLTDMAVYYAEKARWIEENGADLSSDETSPLPLVAAPPIAPSCARR